MLKIKIDKLFPGLPNVFGIVGNMLIAEFDDLADTTMLVSTGFLGYAGKPSQSLTKTNVCTRVQAYHSLMR